MGLSELLEKKKRNTSCVNYVRLAGYSKIYVANVFYFLMNHNENPLCKLFVPCS